MRSWLEALDNDVAGVLRCDSRVCADPMLPPAALDSWLAMESLNDEPCD